MSYHFTMDKEIPRNENRLQMPALNAPMRSRRSFPETPFPCFGCKAENQSLDSLIQHNNNFHKGWKYLCGICHNKFETKAEKDSHKTLLDHGSFPISQFPCYTCRKENFTMAELQTHNTHIHKFWKFECEVCSNKFETKTRKNKHRRSLNH